MARKRSKGNPWVGYEDQVRERLTEALSGRGPGAGSIAQRYCPGLSAPSISKESLMALVADITGQGCKSTLHQWLKDPGRVPRDMAELLSRLLGFDNAEHVRTGEDRATQTGNRSAYGHTSRLLDEAWGYLLMLDEATFEQAVGYLRQLAITHYDGPEKGIALDFVIDGKREAALIEYQEQRRKYEEEPDLDDFVWPKPVIPPEWLEALDRLESAHPRFREVPGGVWRAGL